MDAAEFAKLETTIAERDNEIATLAQTERECSDQVRLFADGRRQAAAKRASVELATKPLREMRAAYVAEQRRIVAEAAEKRAKEDAAKPKPPSEIEMLRQQVAKLTQMIEAKG